MHTSAGTRFPPARHRETLRQKHRANLVLYRDTTTYQGLSKHDQCSPLTHSSPRHPHFGQLAHRLQPRQPLGVVTIGLALQILKLPRLARCVCHLGSKPQFLAKVIHPTCHCAGLEYDHIWTFQFQYPLNVEPVAGDSLKANLSQSSIKHARLTVELPQIDCENLGHSCVLLQKKRDSNVVEQHSILLIAQVAIK